MVGILLHLDVVARKDTGPSADDASPRFILDARAELGTGLLATSRSYYLSSS